MLVVSMLLMLTAYGSASARNSKSPPPVAPPPIIITPLPKTLTRAEISAEIKRHLLDPKVIQDQFSDTKLDRKFFPAFRDYNMSLYGDRYILDFLAEGIEKYQAENREVNQADARAAGARINSKTQAALMGAGLPRLSDEEISRYLSYMYEITRHPACGDPSYGIPSGHQPLHAISQLSEAALRDYFDIQIRAMHAAAVGYPAIQPIAPQEDAWIREAVREAFMQRLREFPPERGSRIINALGKPRDMNRDLCDGLALTFMIIRDAEGEAGPVIRRVMAGTLGK